jgi:hypothetical protein
MSTNNGCTACHCVNISHNIQLPQLWPASFDNVGQSFCTQLIFTARSFMCCVYIKRAFHMFHILF